MNLKGVAPDYGTLVPLFAWRIKRNEFGHFLIITSISNLLSYVLRINYYKVFSSKAVTILNYSFEKFIPLKKKELHIESFLVYSMFLYKVLIKYWYRYF